MFTQARKNWTYEPKVERTVNCIRNKRSEDNNRLRASPDEGERNEERA